jgi:hypothetical protein
MKKILTILFFSAMHGASAQAGLDTVYVRNASFSVRDWWSQLGKQNIEASDSARAFQLKRIYNKIEEVAPRPFVLSFLLTTVVVDSVWGPVALDLYKGIKTTSSGEIATRYGTIVTQWETKSNILPFLTSFSDVQTTDYNRTLLKARHNTYNK